MIKNKFVLGVSVVAFTVASLVIIALVVYSAFSSKNSPAPKSAVNTITSSPNACAPSSCKGKILMVLAFSDFLDQDYFIPKKIFEDNGFVVDTLSTELGVAKSLTGVETKVNVLYSDIKTTDYKAVVFCGGPGMCKQDLNQNYLDLSKAFNSDNKIIGGICFGGKILATSGILKDKKASIPDKFSDFLKQEGITYVKNELVVDGNIVTAPEPPFNKEFAQAIVDLLNKQ